MNTNYTMLESRILPITTEGCFSKLTLGLNPKTKENFSKSSAGSKYNSPPLFSLYHSKLQMKKGKSKHSVIPRNNCVRSMFSTLSVSSEVKDRSNKDQANFILDELRKSCETTEERLRLIIEAMVQEMYDGLEREGGSKDYKMILTYVDKLPSGNEKGHFYALDLGGTNFRVLRVNFGGKGSDLKDQEYQEVSIPQALMHGTHEELFDFIAGKLADFVAKESKAFHPLPGRKRELGFTFSFPVKQTSIDAGTLIKWTKGFAVEGTAGKDVVQSLNEALERRGLDMVVTALVNDTVGTLAVASMGAKNEGDEVMISVILGTGTNACYVENIDAIPKWQGPKPKSGRMGIRTLQKANKDKSRVKDVTLFFDSAYFVENLNPDSSICDDVLKMLCLNRIISMEWGGLSSSYLPRTSYDDDLDAASVNPGEQIFEKLLSGMYLGEVVRRVLLRLAKEALIFGPVIPPKLNERFIIGTPHVSAMHHDESLNLQVVGKVFQNVLGIEETPLDVRKLVVEICSIVTTRAARLAGAGIVGVLKKIGRDRNIGMNRTIVAMDGGLYEHYPLFRQHLMAAVEELLGHEIAKNVVIELSKDGSGIGAALLAAAHSRYNE